MLNKKKILIFGPQSFKYDYAKVSMHFIAEYLADLGNEVTYVGGSCNFLDLCRYRKSDKMIAAWSRKNRYHKINSNLKEYYFRNIFPSNRKFIFCGAQLESYSWLENSFLNQQFDVFITDVSFLVVLSHKVNAKCKVLRVNDIPGGSKGVSLYVTEKIEKCIKENVFDLFFPAADATLQYVERLGIPHSKNIKIPNGVDLNIFNVNYRNKYKNFKNRAVFIGTFNDWFDVGLVNSVANILTDWKFDIYGFGDVPFFTAKNINYKGPLDFKLIPETLSNYTVGIMPFKNTKHIQSSDPLKFFQYIAAGLGVACTLIDSYVLRMKEYAFFGTSPLDFSQAIINAQNNLEMRNCNDLELFLEENSWSNRLSELSNKIHDSLILG